MSGPSGNDRARPSDAGAERALLACLLLEPTLFATVSRLVQAEDFCSPSNRAVYDVIEELALAGRRADAVTVRETLERTHRPPAGGWETYLAQCAAEVPSEAGASDYARVVREKAIRRRFFDLGGTLRDEAGTRELPQLLGLVTESVVAVAGMTFDRPVRTAAEVVEELARSIQEGVQHVPTGLAPLDEAIGGLGRGDLVVIAGRPSMGKSALAQNIADHAATSGKKVLLFTLEMSGRAVVARMVCARTHIPLRRLLAGTLAEAETETVVAALQQIAALPLHFCDRPTLSLADVLAECRRAQALHGLDLVLVDYLQLMRPDTAERREREIALLSAGLKRLAGELDVPVVCLSQLNRDLEKRKNKKPMLADLRDSGSIEQDADVVLMLHREWVYKRSVPPDQAMVFVEKQRNGPRAAVSVRFVAGEFQFAEPR